MKSLQEIDLPANERKALEKAFSVIRGMVSVEKIILFGSKARGDHDAESDLDLLIITREALSRSECHEIIDELFPIQIEYNVVLSPLIVSAGNWTSGLVSVLPIHSEIDEHGAAA